MAAKYREYQQLNLPSIETTILEKWAKHQAFEKSIEVREGAPSFVFYEGPPSANGMPGIHHVISRTLKDLVCRYKTMQGFQVKRKGGWDTHGLPIELGVEKELGITKEDIGKTISIEAYNQKCREAVLRFKDKWDELTNKMGYWVDLKDPYVTFENEYIETLWWLLKRLHEKGLLYKSVSIQPYSPAAGTGLSSHELNQPGTYKDVKDTSAVAMFKAVKDEKTQFLFDSIPSSNLTSQILTLTSSDVFFLAWTTTPWTLPSNLGLTVGPNIDYVLVQTFNPYTHLPVNVVLAKSLLGKYFKPEGENGDFENYTAETKLLPWKILTEFKGSSIEGARYEQLLPYEANSPAEAGGDPFRVLCDTFVTTEDGTGIVHTAPAFGADDYKVGKKYGIGFLAMVDREGKFIDGLGEFSGRFVKNYKDDPNYVDVNVDISVKLKKENRAFKVEKYEHSYPHCWRTDKPVLYYPLDAWFIRTTAVKDRMVELNKTINWKPKTTGEGRFGNWLENMVDWNLSRSRYWGTPLPIWRARDNKNFFDSDNTQGLIEYCVGSIQELLGNNDFTGYKLSNKKDLFQQLSISTSDFYSKVYEWNNQITNPVDSAIFGIDTEKIEIVIKSIDDVTPLNLAMCNIPISFVIEYAKQLDNSDLEIINLHKPFVDDIFYQYKEYDYFIYREPDLIDVWFDSGAMPYAQWGLDQEKLKAGAEQPFNAPFEQNYPADFIAEGVDQTRGWFYTLHALGVLLYDSVAYKTVVSNGLVLDKNGNKMSKRLGNVVDPFSTIQTFGADATRWYLITNASPWDSLKFDLEGIREVQRKFFGTLYNTYQFFVLYANVDGFAYQEASIPLEERPEIDRWILSSLNTLVKEVTAAFDEYEPTQAGRLIEDFVDEQLSNWYVRLCRRRFWKGDYSQDKIAAYQTLYECLETIARLMAPVSPFFADWLFGNLNEVTGRLKGESVHHELYPKADESRIDQSLEERMKLAQDASSLVLGLRKKVNIKVRQPLQRVLIPVLNPAMKEQLLKIEDLIRSEVNVKELQYLTDAEGFIKKKIKPDFKALGKRVGAKMKAVSAAIQAFDQEAISKLEKEGSYSLEIDSEPLILQIHEVEISSEDIPGWLVSSKGALTVALDVTVTPELEQEGNARELVNRIQKIRKDNGYDLTDRIAIKLAGIGTLAASVKQFATYIKTEVLADELELVDQLNEGIPVEVNEQEVTVWVNKLSRS